MKIGYFFYYFQEVGKRQAPRMLHDLRPILEAYDQHATADWKTSIKGDDDESVFLMRTPQPGVWMLGGTRDHDIIKAVNQDSLTCEDIHNRLEAREKTGFVAYFTLDAQRIGMAATLRGPRTAALSRLLNTILHKLGAKTWRCHIGALGTSITVEEAQGLAFMSQTTLKVSPNNGMFNHLCQLISTDSNDVRAFRVTIMGKKNRDLKTVVGRTLSASGTEGLDRMTIRARAAIDDDLTDYYLMTEGRLSEEIDSSSERDIISQVASKFNSSHESINALERAHRAALYQSDPIQDLVGISDVERWIGLMDD